MRSRRGALAAIGPPGSVGGRGGRGDRRGPTGRGDAGRLPRAARPAATVGPASQGRRSQARSPPAARGGFGAAGQRRLHDRAALDLPVAPALTAQDEFFEFLFSGSDMKYAELKELAAKQEPLPPFALKGVKMTINVDADYDVVRTQLTRNVVGIVPGTDATAEGHLRRVRRALRSRRLFAASTGAGRGFGGNAPAPADAPGRRATRRGRATSSTTAPTTTGRGRWR